MSGKITRAFNLHLQLGESTWRCQRLDFSRDKPNQLATLSFPKQTFGKKQPVNMVYKTWSWLHYDEGTDASFCYYCGKADQEGKLKATNKNLAFITKGFTNWKHNL